MDVRRGAIVEAIKKFNINDIDEIGDQTEAGTNCGACHDDLEKVLAETKNGNS